MCKTGLLLKRSGVKDRVAHAYYNYGRVCSAHPASCMTTSVLTIILLSYPLVMRLRMNSDNPVDVLRSVDYSIPYKEYGPKWLSADPFVYIQHIVLQAQLEFSNNTNSPEKNVKDLLSHTFIISKVLKALTREGHEDFKKICFQVGESTGPLTKGLPFSGCFYLSPALFWNNDEHKYYTDEDVLKTLFSSSCNPAFCLRDILLGLPLHATGIRKTYPRSHHVVSLNYGITLFFSKYKNASIASLKNFLSKNFDLLKPATDEISPFLHVFYRPRKYFVSFLPLISSYVLLMFYLYFSVSKIVMVKSKWGLALAAVVTVAATSTMTAGICIHFNLMPTLWGAELFPYLALVIGLENTLCLTRSVVYTPPTMDVRSRIAYGLSQEGYSFTKYFLLEMAFLFIGFLTFVPEIQEFCIFAWIGLVVDFYMQLFFYSPCLTFDLLRLDPEDKQRFSSMLFYSDIRRYKNYPNPKCPFSRIWPRLFGKKIKLFRVQSDPQMRDYEANKKIKKHICHRRTTSSFHAEDTARTPSTRMRLLYFWTRTRIVNRVVMVVFVVWTVWFGIFVQSWHFSSIFSATLQANTGSDISNHEKLLSGAKVASKAVDGAFEVPQLKWKEWQSQMFRWWPALFGKYNISLSGRYITILPTMFLKDMVRQNETSNHFDTNSYMEIGVQKDQDTISPSVTESRLMTRIYTLETQMAIILMISAIFLVATVGAFLLYVCFWERSQKDSDDLAKRALLTGGDVRGFHGRFARKFLETEPVCFSGHKLSIECVGVIKSNQIASSCFEGKVFVWNAVTGKKLKTIDRFRRRSAQKADLSSMNARVLFNRDSVAPKGLEKVNQSTVTQVWCMAVRQCILFFGCADGVLEIANAETGTIIGTYQSSQSRSGIVHLLIRGTRVIIARIDSSVEIVDICFSIDQPFSLQSMKQVALIECHRSAITHFEATSLSLITISQDRIIRVFDIRSAMLNYALKGHNTAIISACVDQMTSVLYTSCEEGIICSWDLENGKLIRTIDDVFLTNEFVELACTASMLLGYSSDGHLWIWDKSSGQLITRITPDAASCKNQAEKRCITVVNNQIAATNCGASVLFWDLNYKVMAKQVYIDGLVDKLVALNQKSVLCSSSRTLYRIDVPVIRFG